VFVTGKACNQQDNDRANNPNIGNVTNEPSPISDEVDNVATSPSRFLNKTINQVTSRTAKEQSTSERKQARVNARKIHDYRSNNNAGDTGEDDCRM